MTKQRKRRQSLQRGQALVEYSLLGHVLLVVGAGAAWPFFTVFMKALHAYYEGLFFVLTSPAL